MTDGRVPGKSLKEFRVAVSDRRGGVRSRGERPPTRGGPEPEETIEMQYLLSVINDSDSLEIGRAHV